MICIIFHALNKTQNMVCITIHVIRNMICIIFHAAKYGMYHYSRDTEYDTYHLSRESKRENTLELAVGGGRESTVQSIEMKIGPSLAMVTDDEGGDEDGEEDDPAVQLQPFPPSIPKNIIPESTTTIFTITDSTETTSYLQECGTISYRSQAQTPPI